MAGKVQVGIIGCGKIAGYDHVPGYQSASGVQIAALYDPDERAATKLQQQFRLDAAIYTDFDAFLHAQLDAVSVCSPNFLHYPQSMAALKAGMHVLCEKPMAATTAQCSRMIAAAEKRGVILQINQTLHYVPLYVKIADLVARGAIGVPQHIRCIRTSASTPNIGWSPGADWFVSKKAQGGLLLDIGVHMADLIKWIAGDITEVVADAATRTKGIDVLDNVTALMRFENGATGILELSWTTPVPAGMLEIHGTNGQLRQGFSKEHPLELIRPTGPKGRLKTTWPKVKASVPNSQQCFMNAIRGKVPSPTAGAVGRDAIALCEAIEKSARTGRFTQVKRF